MSRRTRLVGTVAGVVLAIAATGAGVWLASLAPADTAATEPDGSIDPRLAALWQRPAVSDSGLVGTSGVRIVQVALTGGGGLIDLRFQVIDPNKADAINAEATPPGLIDESTGLIVSSPLMGHQGVHSYKTGLTYYIVFENPGNLVQRDAKVSVLLGNAQVEHVVVR
jgi:hypothetical protein